MLGKQAKTISPGTLRRMLAYAGRTRSPERDRVMILLSLRAGLRACEIARLEWSMVRDARGQIADPLEIRSSIAKKGGGRRVPLHPQLKKALNELYLAEGAFGGFVIRSAHGGAMQPNSIVNWFVVMFRALGVEGCSSHSGRRTFITNAARQLHKVGASLRDVQLLAGHRSIETTQGYIDGDSQAQRRLVSLL